MAADALIFTARNCSGLLSAMQGGEAARHRERYLGTRGQWKPGSKPENSDSSIRRHPWRGIKGRSSPRGPRTPTARLLRRPRQRVLATHGRSMFPTELAWREVRFWSCCTSITGPNGGAELSEVKMALRSSSIMSADPKPPQAAVVKVRWWERCGKRRYE